MTIDQITQDCRNWLKEARIEAVSPELADELFAEEQKELWTALRKDETLKIADAIIDLYWVASNESDERMRTAKLNAVTAMREWFWPFAVNFDLYAKAVSISNWSKLDASIEQLKKDEQSEWFINKNLTEGHHLRDASGKIRKPSTYKDAETIYLELVNSI